MVNTIWEKEFEEFEKKKNSEIPDVVSGRITISTTISPEFHQLAKKNDIKWSEAMRVGLSVLFAEKGLKEYDNTLNLYRKMKFFQQKVEEYSDRIAEFEQKHEELKNETKNRGSIQSDMDKN